MKLFLASSFSKLLYNETKLLVKIEHSSIGVCCKTMKKFIKSLLKSDAKIELQTLDLLPTQVSGVVIISLILLHCFFLSVPPISTTVLV